MKRKLIAFFCLLSIAIAMAGCGEKSEETITIVLDWTPNTNHTGLYVAMEKGYFDEAGIDAKIVQPPEDGAETLVASGKAQFGISFQDIIAPAFASDDPLPVVAIAALVQHNTSGIISLKGEGIDNPKGMSNKTYATWDAPIEKAMIKSVVETDGGDYDSIVMVPSTVTDVITALNTNIDAIWVYYAWDGIAAEIKGIETDFFAFKDIDPIFDYYSPILIGNVNYMKENKEKTKAFLQAAAKGYEYAIANPEEAADILVNANPELDRGLVLESQKWIAGQYKSEVEQWGFIDRNRWDDFFSWLWDKSLIEKEIPSEFGFTNEYLPY